MGGRRKRPKSARSIESCGLGSTVSAGRESADEFRFPVQASSFDCGSFASRCSVRVINEVVSKFDQVKRDLAKSIGFGSILQFPIFKQFNRKFSLWLMSCVNEQSCILSIEDHISIRFCKDDVRHVIGIPASGKSVLDVRICSREAKEKVLNDYLPPDFKELRSVKLVQEVLEREYEYPMTKIEADRFKVAFVVFVASNLLAPSAKYDYACVDYWNGIQDPDSIGTYDWSEYVIARLVEGVTKLKQDIASNIKFPNITGCSLFLQVLYLDSLSLEGISKAHTRLPRIIDFSHESLRLMIQADRNYCRYEKNQMTLPVGELRDPYKCIYSWAHDHIFMNEVSTDGCMFAAWEASVAMVNLLNVPLEAAGPIFVAVSDFQEQINSGLVLSGIQSVKIMAVLVSIMLPFARGFRYQSSHTVEAMNHGRSLVGSLVKNGTRRLSFPVRCRRSRVGKTRSLQDTAGKHPVNGILSGGSFGGNSASSAAHVTASHDVRGTDGIIERRVQAVIASIDEIPHKLNINLRVATSMSQFYSAIRNIKPARNFDLNALSSEESSCAPEIASVILDVPSALPSPWELGYGWAIDVLDTSTVFSVINTVECDDSFVVVHCVPKYIQVSLRALCDQILGKCEFELDLMDALTRNVIQEDDELYSAFGGARWRVFFESDFMEAILTGSFDLVDADLGKNLGLSNTYFDFAKSKLVFFPLLLQCSWLCFTWNLEDNVLYVFEPSYAEPVPRYREEAIERSAFLLKLALQTLCSSVFSGVYCDANCAELRFITLPHTLVNRANRSGVWCSLYCRSFDGDSMNAKENVDAVAAKLLKHLCNLKNNSGSFPQKLLSEL